MDHLPEFVKEHLIAAQDLIKGGSVREPIFSRGTYQYEVVEKGRKKEFPFIQMKDDGKITDSFCSCKLSESGFGCPHLSAAYLSIFQGFDEPLHIRYKNSLWNRLFQMASKRHGYETSCLKKEGEGKYTVESKDKIPFFSIEALNVKAKKKLESIVSKRQVETEETSIKFSNLPTEEIVRYREGKASHNLSFDLSFWSDLAKWLMFLEDSGKGYEISFKGAPIPNEITLQFPGLAIWFHISDVNWPWIIPSLSTVNSPLKVFGAEEELIQHVHYDEIKRCLKIEHKEQKRLSEAGVPIGDWQYVEGKGFYRRRSDLLLSQDEIPFEKIASVLNQSSKTLAHFLPIFSEKRAGQYQLHFDSQANLHIELFVLEPADLRGERAACFAPWVYLPDHGFFLLDNWLFEGKEKIILKGEVADFINRHRLWLQNFPGFKTHLGSLESHLTYRITNEGDLLFHAELNFPEDYEEIYHFDEWVYIKGEGFYMKKEASGRLPLHPGQKVSKEEVSSFISSHKDDLEQVQHFYNPEMPIRKMGLNITINEDGLIAILPQMEYAPGVDPSTLKHFGEYVYIEGKGFSDIPLAGRLPEKYQHPVVIAPSAELSFLSYELEPLKPYTIKVDPRLVRAENLKLKIRRIVPSKRKRGKEWFVDLVYATENGHIDVFSIWDAFQEKKRHLFSNAGLINLKEPRFNWIRQLQKKRLDRNKKLLRLNTLEWIRLNAFEELEPPHDLETRKLLEELNRFEAGRLLDVSRLKATLRPYQEQGLSWLWFLYCHGLSGLLCDDMGLGKTHQTMALLAAVINEDDEKVNKYLVVCPTSVIYHWQELLKRFLPEIRVCTYYGLERTLENFEENYDLILTSYGILRTGKENLKAHKFEVAIFDEIQIAKNYASQTHKALRSIRAQMRLGLTGTPIENRLRELKSLIDIVLPSYMPPDPIFRDVFTNPIEKNQDAEKKALLGKLVKPFVLRRKKSEVLTDLPEKIEEIAYCDMSPEQKELYKEVAFKMRDTIYQDLKNNEKPVPFVHVFSALSTLKQICDHPALVLKDSKNYRTHQSGKWDLFVELLYEARDSGQKVVIFSQYLEMLSIIESYLKKKGIGFATIKGSTRDRPEQLRRFREDPDCEVFTASLLAAGVGIDLTAGSIVIHYDRWWNPAKENQATDRVHRIGQNRGVQVFKLVTKNSIEEHIHEMIERKKGLLEDIIGQEDQISYLSRDELLQIFEKMFSEIE
ncbi:MAG: ATP-dependent helicase [Chlamydiae bacterium CG10_big_fil_rev_8_21_14_0_10_42_34]|nr:MAG: ATP-dependent helicase [Chlamydiae bacterium CG10_big_fil_rev_8_21_14_0_10_42_34]